MSEEMIQVFSYSVTYLIKQISAFDYQKAMHVHCNHTQFSAKDFRLKLQHNSQYNLYIKLFVCNGFRYGAPKDRRQLLTLAEQHLVSRSDATLINALYLECPWFRKECKDFCASVDYGGRHTSVQALDRQFNEMYPALLKYAKNFAYRKLRFLYEAHNETRDVYTSELLEKAARAFYTMVPVSVSELHLLNKLKQSIDNHGTNIIYRETSLKASRLQQGEVNEHGIRSSAQLVCASFSQLYRREQDEEIKDPEIAVHPFAKFEMQFSISQILSRLDMASRRYRMLLILMGEENSEFNSWLVTNKHCKAGSGHEEVQQNLDPKEFNSLVCQFLNFSERKAEAFLKKISASLPHGVSHVIA